MIVKRVTIFCVLVVLLRGSMGIWSGCLFVRDFADDKESESVTVTVNATAREIRYAFSNAMRAQGSQLSGVVESQNVTQNVTPSETPSETPSVWKSVDDQKI